MVDRPLRLMSGGLMLFVFLALIPAAFAWDIYQIVHSREWFPFIPIVVLLPIVWFIGLFGFFVVSPNQTKVVQLFGRYVGTVSDVGLFYGNPFYLTTKVSLRMRTFETGMGKPEEKREANGTVTKTAAPKRQPMKVNDKDGTPIDIAAVVVWKVVNPARAVFEVDDYERFVELQADTALRNLASRYSYDAPESDIHSLRGHIEEVSEGLKKELKECLKDAGVDVIDSRISYLAYAPEIAAAMLQRQQATAIVAARRIIVSNAVSMVEMALEELQSKNIVELDPERRVAMISNLLVVLCSHSSVQPVVNSGTIYS